MKSRSRRRFLRDSARLVGALTFGSRPARTQNTSNEFDYVVVGAGSSGCVLASRLSADPHTRVLLLEAGGPDANPLIHLPGKWTTLIGSEVDWNYTTEPEAGLLNRRLRWPRGKTYGGSSAMNAMAYVRGHQLCFATWAERAGPSWSFNGVLPYFRRVEGNSRGASDYHGAGGPLVVSDTTDPHAGHLAFLDAAREHGFAARPDWDFNGPRQDNGAGFYQKNIRNGRRHSAADAFLRPVLARPNLVVWPHSHVARLAFSDRRATRVHIVRGGKPEEISVAREVVLSAGVIETPKILMLSGIGPADLLRSLGIPVVMDAPDVGANLHDHPRVSVRWNARMPLAPSTVSAGLFTSSQGRVSDRPPDLQFYVGRGIDTPDQFVTLTVALSQPLSRGSLRLTSSDPLKPPAIHGGYFDEGRDLEALLEGVRLARSIGESRAYDAIRGAAAEPGTGVRTAAEVREFIRRTADTIFHPVGTCRMGNDASAVVDAQLRVRGVEGVRVADASVMPITVNSQTHAACVMIGDKAAELIIGNRGTGNRLMAEPSGN